MISAEPHQAPNLPMLSHLGLVGHEPKANWRRETVWVVTGHGPFNAHLFRIGVRLTGSCEICLNENQDSWHVLIHCPHWTDARNRLINKAGSWDLGLAGSDKLEANLAALDELCREICRYLLSRPEHKSTSSDVNNRDMQTAPAYREENNASAHGSNAATAQEMESARGSLHLGEIKQSPSFVYIALHSVSSVLLELILIDFTYNLVVDPYNMSAQPDKKTWERFLERYYLDELNVTKEAAMIKRLCDIIIAQQRKLEGEQPIKGREAAKVVLDLVFEAETGASVELRSRMQMLCGSASTRTCVVPTRYQRIHGGLKLYKPSS